MSQQKNKEKYKRIYDQDGNWIAIEKYELLTKEEVFKKYKINIP